MQNVFRARSQSVDESRTHFPRTTARSSNSRMRRSRCVQRPLCEKSFQLQKLQNHEARSPSRRARPARETHLVQLRRQRDRRSLFKHVHRHEKSIQGRRHRRVERRLRRWVHSDLTPDLGESDHYSLLKSGTVRLEITFAEALAHTINVIVYAEFQNVLEIDRNRNVFFDFAA